MVDVVTKRFGFKLGDASIGAPHDYGEGLRRINLDSAVTAHLARAALEEDGVRDFGRTRLASYKVPRRVLFFGDGELETTGTDKVKVAALRDLAIQRLGAAAS